MRFDGKVFPFLNLTGCLNLEVSNSLRTIIWIVLIIGPISFLFSQYDPSTKFSSLVFFGSDFNQNIVPELIDIPRKIYWGSGYDGQFYAQMAVHPVFNDSILLNAVDNPTYRFRRIFLPLLANIIGLGQPFLILQTYALINVLFFILTAWGLSRFIQPKRVKDFLIINAILWSTGTIASLTRALPDLPTSVFLILSILGQGGAKYLLLACAFLTKETSIIGLITVLDMEKWSFRQLVKLIPKILITLMPICIWVGYLIFAIPPTSFFGSSNFSFPFFGYIHHINLSFQNLGSPSLRFEAIGELAAITTLTVQAFYLFIKPAWNNPFWRLGIGFALLFFILGDSVFVEQLAYTRAVLPLSFAFNLLIWQKENKNFHKWFALGNVGLFLGLLISFLRFL
jgi:hypothetical protein